MVAAPTTRQPLGGARPFTVAEYHRLLDAGVLPETERVELLEGWIVESMTRKPPHDARLDQAHEVVRERLPAGWRVRVQSAITLEDSEPEPDLAVVVGPASRYLERHPGPSDIALVIEVADSSLALDRDVKARVYARAGIATYWIVNLVDARVEVYTRPSGAVEVPAYGTCAIYGLEGEVPLEIAGSCSVVRVRDVLG